MIPLNEPQPNLPALNFVEIPVAAVVSRPRQHRFARAEELVRGPQARAPDQVRAVFAVEQVDPTIVGKDTARVVNAANGCQKAREPSLPAGFICPSRLAELEGDQLRSRRLAVRRVVAKLPSGNESRANHRDHKPSPEPEQNFGKERIHLAKSEFIEPVRLPECGRTGI